MVIATLIASDKLASGHISDARDYLRDLGFEPSDAIWIEQGRVADIAFEGNIDIAQKTLSPLQDEVDFIIQPSENRCKKLLISDMDSTMITVECIDELADYAGIKDAIAHVTERAMRGELDFEEALRSRVALLQGLKSDMIDICLRERVIMSEGAKIVIQTMRSMGAHCVLVSGGFNQFAKSVANELGFHEYYANELSMKNDILSGEVEGVIVDAERKKMILESIIESKGWSIHDTIAVGDGANDIPMIEAAGIGVAYHAKPAAEEAADMILRHNDLTALLSAQGIERKNWIS